MTATKITKGTEVWMFGDWNLKGKVFIRRMTITSFGKKQATAVRVKDGKNAEFRIYADDYANLVAVADLADPADYAMSLAVAQKAKHVKRAADNAHWNMDSTSKGYLEALKKHCEEVIADEPGFVFA
jgi:hypothetical protein